MERNLIMNQDPAIIDNQKKKEAEDFFLSHNIDFTEKISLLPDYACTPFLSPINVGNKNMGLHWTRLTNTSTPTEPII